MKIATVADRAALVLGDEIADVASASHGRFSPDPMSVYDDWDAFAAAPIPERETSRLAGTSAARAAFM